MSTMNVGGAPAGLEQQFESPASPWTSADWLVAGGMVQEEAGAAAQTIVSAGAIATAQAFGSAQINFRIFPGAIASLGAFGTATTKFNVVPGGITTAQAFGTASVGFRITTAAIGSVEAFGTPSVAFRLATSAIASLEAWGSAQLNLRVLASGIGAAESAGTAAVLQASPQTIAVDAIAGGESFGALFIGEPPQEQLFFPPPAGRARPERPLPPRAPAIARPRRLGAIGAPTAEAFGGPELSISRAPQALEALAFSASSRSGTPQLARKPSARQLADELEEIFDIAA